jgi:hypothetical protein
METGFNVYSILEISPLKCKERSVFIALLPNNHGIIVIIAYFAGFIFPKQPPRKGYSFCNHVDSV